jgi:hypothetical protein
MPSCSGTVPVWRSAALLMAPNADAATCTCGTWSCRCNSTCQGALMQGVLAADENAETAGENQAVMHGQVLCSACSTQHTA